MPSLLVLLPRSRALATALALAALALATAPAARAQGERRAEDSVRALERRIEQRQRAAERDAERRARTAERAAERSERDADRDDDDDDGSARRANGQPAVSRVDTTLAFDRGGSVDLELVSGRIEVTSWDRNEIRIRARAERGDLRLEASRSHVSLDVRGGRRGMGDTRYDVTIPAGTRLTMQTVSGDVVARGVRGDVDARTTSGDVTLTDVGRLVFESVSGDVEVSGATGGARGSTVSGGVRLARVTGDVDVSTVSGDVGAPGARSKSVRMESVSGELAYDGSVDSDGRYEFHSHSGQITLSLPANVGAQLSLETFSGEIDSTFPLTLRPSGRGSDGPRRLDFTLGSGGARITAETFSGDVVLERGGTSTPRQD